MNRHLNVSPWILAAACSLLAVIIGSFAVTNYTREKELMTQALLQRGISIIGFVDSGMRVSMRGQMLGGGRDLYSWTEHVQEVLSQVQEEDDLHYVELVDSSGVVRAANDLSRVGSRVTGEISRFLDAGGRGEPIFRMVKDDEGNRAAFQVARAYTFRMPRNQSHHMMRNRAFGERGDRDRGEVNQLLAELERLRGQEFLLLVELDIEQFDQAVKRQMLQIVILSIVLLLVGIGGWLSLLTLQGLKGSQSRLREIRAFNDILIDSLPVGLIATDGNGLIRTINGAAEKIVGIDSDGAVGKMPEQMLHPDLAEMLTSAGNPSLESASRECSIADVEGKLRHLLLTVRPVGGSGEDSGDVLLVQDMTELRGLEDQLKRSERLAALGKMAAGVAHELRNPLSSIKGLAVLLKTKVTGDVQGSETADVLVGEVERLNRSIGELLDYARPEKLDLVEVDLAGLLRRTIALVGIDAESQGVSLLTDFDPDHCSVHVDEDRIMQVFLNILLNGIQAMEEGGTIRISTRLTNGNVRCLIEDNGMGIGDEDLPRIFDPYFTTKNDGTGLGLAISAKIVEEHGGNIGITSTLGSGTQVKVELPRVV